MKDFSVKFGRLLLPMVFLTASCGDIPTPVPVVPNLNFYTSIYTNNLMHVGGYEYFTGAIRGLVVYRVDMTTFCAYDRACSYDWREEGYVSVDTSNTFRLICGQCHSTFSILSGYPIGNANKAEAPLRAYKATMVDDINLRVYN